MHIKYKCIGLQGTRQTGRTGGQARKPAQTLSQQCSSDALVALRVGKSTSIGLEPANLEVGPAENLPLKCPPSLTATTIHKHFASGRGSDNHRKGMGLKPIRTVPIMVVLYYNKLSC